MKIGLYGGTFNPIHRGHLSAARAAAEQLGLDRLLLIPANIPPHKALPQFGASPQQRLEMTQLATAELGSWAEVSDIELRRTGKSYTSDTVRALKALYPEAELWLLMGSDMFLSLHTWHEPEIILSLVSVCAFSRLACDEQEPFTRQKEYLERTYGARIALVENPDVIEISSGALRADMSASRVKDMLPAAVYGYILRQKLYGTSCELTCLSPDELRPIALSYLKPKRMPHVLGTEEEAVRLAKRYGADETSARIAALLHDCTKKLELGEQLALCMAYGIALDEVERRTLKLLHSKTGAALAKEVFAVSDAVYEAILWHTTGKPDMTLLEKVIYMADYIEPNRDFEGVEELRRLTYEDLDRGVLLGLTETIREMEEKGQPVHKNTLEARNYLLQKGVTI